MESWSTTKMNQRPRSKALMNPSCKKHPKHRQSPGVCSVCLSEKLSQISTNKVSNSRRKVAATSPSTSSSSDVSSLSSSNESSYSTPRVLDPNVLKKSRSMASVLQRRKPREDKSSVKKGFWSKLLPRRNKGLMHSRTTRERVIKVH